MGDDGGSRIASTAYTHTYQYYIVYKPIEEQSDNAVGRKTEGSHADTAPECIAA